MHFSGKLFAINPCPTIYQTQPYPAGYLAREPERLYTEMALVSPLTPFMLRNVYLVLVLAALAATSAAASPVVPAKASKLAHHKTVHATARATHRAAVRPAGHAAAGRSRSRRRFITGFIALPAGAKSCQGAHNSESASGPASRPCAVRRWCAGGCTCRLPLSKGRLNRWRGRTSAPRQTAWSASSTNRTSPTASSRDCWCRSRLRRRWRSIPT